MLKPLTLSLSLAVALGICSVGMAGHGHAIPSGQGVYPTEQVIPSEQGCYEPCGPVAKHCGLLDGLKGMLHRPKCYTYEWVLKKKRVRHSLFSGFGHGHGGGCGDVGCGSCETVYPSGQGVYAAPQGGDIYGSGQAAPVYGATQMTAPISYGAGQAAPADASTEPPAIPADAPDQSASAGGLLFLSPTR